MKTAILLFALLVTTASADLAKRLQQGLVEEEVNRDPKAAIEHYAKLLEDFDAGRQFAATALFRTAECHRKLGDDEAAIESFGRLAQLFPEQEKLVSLAKENLTALGVELEPQAPELDFSALTSAEADSLKELRTIARDSPDLISSDDSTRLSDAIENGHAEVAHFLVKNGAELNQSKEYELSPRSFRNMTPLEFAVRKGNLRIVNTLLAAGADLLPGAVSMAIEQNRNSIVGVLLEVIADKHPDFDYFYPLSTALRHDRRDLFDKMLAQGASAEAQSSGGWTLLHRAAGGTDPGQIKLLVETHKLRIDSKNEEGFTALDIATARRHADMVKALLALGANPNNVATKRYFGSPSQSDVTTVMQTLGARYADSDHRDENLQNLKALIAAGAELDAQDSSGNTALHCAVAFAVSTRSDALQNPDLDYENPQKSRPSLAVWNDAVAALLEAGADTSITNELGAPAIAYAKNTSLHQLLHNYSILESPGRSEHVLVRQKDMPTRISHTRAAPDQSPPSVADLLIADAFGNVAPSNISISPMDGGEAKHYDLIALASAENPSFPEIAWGDLVEVDPQQYLNSVGLGKIRDFVLPEARQKVTVKRGDLEAEFTITPPLLGLPKSWDLYDPSSGIVHDVRTPLDLAKNAFLITPNTARSLAKLIRADGETLKVSLMEGAKDQPELQDGDRLEIVEGEHTPDDQHAITCDQRLLYWNTGIHNRECSLADLIGIAYSGSAPFVIRRPDFENMNARIVGEDDAVTKARWDFAKMITEAGGPGFGDGGSVLDIPFVPWADEGEAWTGLTPKVVEWLEEQLSYTVEIKALDQPIRTMKIGPEIFHYRESAGYVVRELLETGADDRFEARGIESNRLVLNAGYGDEKLYNWRHAGVVDKALDRRLGTSVWLPDGALIGISAPRPRTGKTTAMPAAAAAAAQQSQGKSSRTTGRRVVLPPPPKSR